MLLLDDGLTCLEMGDTTDNAGFASSSKWTLRMQQASESRIQSQLVPPRAVPAGAAMRDGGTLSFLTEVRCMGRP